MSSKNRNDKIATQPNAQQPVAAEKPPTFGQALNANSRLLADLAGWSVDSTDFKTFKANAYATVTGNPKILECSMSSILQCIAEAAKFKLSTNPLDGECYLIPRKNKCTFLIGYQGLLRLMWRTGMVDSIYADVVYKGAKYRRVGGTEQPRIEHEPDDLEGKRTGKFADIVVAYAVVTIKGSHTPVFRSFTKLDLTAAKGMNQYSDVWDKWPEAMARKTALRRVIRMVPRDANTDIIHAAAIRDELREEGRESEVEALIDAESGTTHRQQSNAALAVLMEREQPKPQTREPGDDPDDGEIIDASVDDGADAFDSFAGSE
jgi:recombination protein RecT